MSKEMGKNFLFVIEEQLTTYNLFSHCPGVIKFDLHWHSVNSYDAILLSDPME